MRIFGKANQNATERTYANSFSYTADGRIEKLRLGNGLWESAKFNNRLQVTEFNLGIGVNDASRWKMQYEYGELQSNGTVDTTKNTGNIARTTSSFAGLTNPFVQSFKYDSLYRLIEATEKVGTTQTWKQNFGYDRFGNRTSFTNEIGGQVQQNTNITHPSIDAATNRFSANQGYQFDKNGNLVTDAASRSFIFNGENKQTEVRDASNPNPQTNLIGRYFYDGEGKRIKKETATEITIFVYSGGKLIAEYSTAAPSQNPTTSYTMTDMLDSPRVITNAFGEVTSRRDFKPFGEELPTDANYRTANRKYGAQDNIRQKFTGYQKDVETNLDFAEARMYQNLHGRFTAVDPLLASGKSANPQTFNRYVYVINNPLVFTDPSGLQVASQTGKVYQRGDSFRIFRDGKVLRNYRPVTRTIKTTTVIKGVVHHLTVTPNGWKVGNRVDGITREVAAASNNTEQGDYRVRALANGFHRQMQVQPGRFAVGSGIAGLIIACVVLCPAAGPTAVYGGGATAVTLGTATPACGTAQEGGGGGGGSPCGGFPNQLPERLQKELETADRLGVTPLMVGDEGFSSLVNQGATVKWAITENGQLVIIPKFVNGTEISHSVLTRGASVLAAGEGELAGTATNPLIFNITNHSGHFMPQPADKIIEMGREAFERNGVTVLR